MDIRVLKTQNIFYEINSGVAAVLIDAGIAEQFVHVPKPKAALPTWSTVLIPPFNRPAIRHVQGNREDFWSGAAANVADAFKVYRWNGAAQKSLWDDLYGPVPKQIQEDYCALLTMDEAEKWAAIMAQERRNNPQTLEEALRQRGR
jgi:hypothetical protein